MKLSQEEILQIVDQLEQKNKLFRTLWNISSFVFTDCIPTAAVEYTDSKINLLFNKQFWDQLTEQGRLFVLCHEQLHIVLDHFNRLKFNQGDINLKNIAADLAVNHFLIRQFSFSKDDLPNWEKYCWVDTVFPDQQISDNETALYYYTLLKSQPFNEKDQHTHTVDQHNTGADIPKDIKKIIEDAIAKGLDQTTIEDSQAIEDFMEQHGSEFSLGGNTNITQQHSYKRKSCLKWKIVYKKIIKKITKDVAKYHWLNRNRNHRLLPDDLLLPSDVDISKEDRAKVHVYLDTSGSCEQDAKYFLKSALTFPSKMFDVEYFGFSTSVYPISKTPPHKLKNFGGTDFHAILKHSIHYPKLDAIFVFTDGFGNTIFPDNPKIWHWFILPNGTKKFIDPNSHTYDLTQLNWKQ